MSVETKSLSPARRWIVHRMHEVFHGSMHNVVVRGGEPVIDPPPKIKESVKLERRSKRSKPVPAEFLLKDQHVALFDLMDEKQNGVISKLVIQEGLPFLAEFETD